MIERICSLLETDDNRVNLSLTFPLFQKHTDLMSDRLVQFGPDLESNEVVQIRMNEVRVGQKSRM